VGGDYLSLSREDPVRSGYSQSSLLLEDPVVRFHEQKISRLFRRRIQCQEFINRKSDIC
jgi:hypothetical protein